MKALVVLALALGACTAREQKDTTPALPALRLVPRVAELEALVAQATPPDADRAAQLVDLGRTAFESSQADARLAARSRSALLAEPDATWALEQLLTHAQAEVRSHAAFALGELGARASTPTLVLRLKYERDPTVLVWIGDALAAQGNGSGLLLLADAMAGDVAQTAGTQAIAILRRAEQTVGEAPSYSELQAGLRTLHGHWRTHGLLPPDTAPSVDAGFDARVAQRLLLLNGFQLRPVDDTRFVLARCGRAGMPLLRVAASASEPYLRTHALEVMRELGPLAAEAIDDVLPLLGDPLCRVDAVRSLSAMRVAAAARFLRPWLAHQDLELRAAVAAALGPVGDHEAEPLLLKMMQDATETMDARVAAAFSVAILARDNPGLRFLRARLQAGDYHPPTTRELLERAEAWR